MVCCQRQWFNAVHYLHRVQKICHALHDIHPRNKEIIMQHQNMQSTLLVWEWRGFRKTTLNFSLVLLTVWT
jgi:hypothetical protein